MEAEEMRVIAAVKRTLVLTAAISLLGGIAANGADKDAAAKDNSAKAGAPESFDHIKKRLKPGTYAVIDTTMGRILCELYPKVAPIGADNFIGLAEGTKEWTDPRTNKKVKKPFYDGLIFHRVIPGFMIQGGDPLGSGIGGPGYKFVNETSPEVTFDRAGRLAYANAGPDTNGSQFFITHNATPNLDGGYTIFGQCIEGQSVVNMIGNVKRGMHDRPNVDVVMTKVTILRVEAGKVKEKKKK
jgi:peptidyl-prolyl cis-trans isomerase A (cyclophilin A)